MDTALGELEQLLRCVAGVRDQARSVDLGRVQFRADEAAGQIRPGQLVVAVHVGDHIPNAPLRAQTRGVPLLGCQLLKEGEQISALSDSVVAEVVKGHGAQPIDDLIRARARCPQRELASVVVVVLGRVVVDLA
jgi:hypothetical protein